MFQLVVQQWLSCLRGRTRALHTWGSATHPPPTLQKQKKKSSHLPKYISGATSSPPHHPTSIFSFFSALQNTDFSSLSPPNSAAFVKTCYFPSLRLSEGQSSPVVSAARGWWLSCLRRGVGHNHTVENWRENLLRCSYFFRKKFFGVLSCCYSGPE